MSFFSLSLLLTMLAGPDDFSMVLPISPETAEGQRLIAVRAVELCGRRFPLLERYEFEGLERVSPEGDRQTQFVVRQQMTCSETAPPRIATEPAAPSDWRPSAEDERNAIELTLRYFAAVDTNDLDQAHSFWSADQQTDESNEARARQIRELRRKGGTPGAHRVIRLTWYVNPEGAPRTGIYVAADYERSYSGFHANCGYLMWFREAAGHYVLIREETNQVPLGVTAESPESIQRARELARCPG